MKIRNIEDILTQEKGREVGEGEKEIVSEEECLEEGAQAFPSKTEQGEWQCPLCDSKFKRKRIFWCHNENVHKRFTCSCKKQFISRYQLEDHIKRVHDGVASHFCHLCSVACWYVEHKDYRIPHVPGKS